MSFNTTTNGFIINLEEVYNIEVHQAGRKKEDVLCKEDLLQCVKDVLFDYLHSVRHYNKIEGRIKVEQYGNYFKVKDGYLFKFLIHFKHPITIFSETIYIKIKDLSKITKDEIVIPKAVTKTFKHFIKLIKIYEKKRYSQNEN